MTIQSPKKGSPKNKGLQEEFARITGLSPVLDTEYKTAFEALEKYLGEKKIRNLPERRAAFISFINKKFDLNSKAVGHLFTTFANQGHTFNFHQKNAIQKAFDNNDVEALQKVIKEKKIENEVNLKELFTPVTEAETLAHIQKEVKNPSKLRIEQGAREIGNEILKALFSAFLWVSLPEKEMHQYFDPDFSAKNYRLSFWEQLQARSPELFNRDHALHILGVNKEFYKGPHTAESARHQLLSVIPELYEKVNNHGFLAVIVEPIFLSGRAMEWELASDFILAAEKFKEAPLEKNYFPQERIKNETLNYIKSLDEETSRFDLVNEGFTYRDTFILSKGTDIERLVLIFQKNERDETLIPCPGCRSNKVQGNSYSSLGVRSWECNNPLCPDRSKYNRGKRYSFRGLLMQQAIESDDSIIPVESVRRWRRDVVEGATQEELLDMLVRHYSIHKDVVRIHNWRLGIEQHLGRKLVYEKLETKKQTSFFDAHLFKRYVSFKEKEPAELQNLGDENFQVYSGDASAVLPNFPDNIFDGAVTSPPYFNAREYSQWPNIYCYLHDMLNINKEVFRTLKPGSFYLYNIFDYFDNENTVAPSAMGQKRMILSAYTVDLFRRIGFELTGNLSWDKGDIEGKRGFNAGNFSPFYQAPFNCWEHILVFRKPSNEKASKFSSRVFKCKPVMKMIKGENIHGHTAPFPDELPEILMSQLSAGSLVVDPFSGSLTTGRVAERYNIRSVNIELSKEYCELGLNKRRENSMDLNLTQPTSKKVRA